VCGKECVDECEARGEAGGSQLSDGLSSFKLKLLAVSSSSLFSSLE
jgi:hypothetical protein